MDSDTSRSLTPSESSFTSSPSPTSPARRQSSKKKKKMSVTVPKPFNLSLNARAEERTRFDHEQKLKQEKQQKINQELKDREEEEARRELKRKPSFKANHVRTFKQVLIQPSARPLTQPESPVLRTSMLNEIKSELRKRSVEESEIINRGRKRVRGRRKRQSSSIGSSRASSESPTLSLTEIDGPLEESLMTTKLQESELTCPQDEEEVKDNEQQIMKGDDGRRGWTNVMIVFEIIAIVAYYIVIYYTVYLVCS